MTTMSLFEKMSDAQLLAEVKRLAGCERHATADLIQSLMELDARRLYLGEGCASLFTYCTRVLRLSEHAAYGRIEAARAARRHPVIVDLLRDGSVALTTVTLLKPHLTVENHRDVLDAARHKSKREVELLIAGLRPQPDLPERVRKLPERRVTPPQAAPVVADDAPTLPSLVQPMAEPVCASPAPKPAVVRPLAPERVGVQFTMSRDTYDKLTRAQDLLRHVIPNGDLAAVFDRALAVLLADLEKSKLAAARRPRASQPTTTHSRHIPAAIKRAVWARDAGRCAFVGAEGRCEETGFLEFHHRVPYADGGDATIANVELRCKPHNAHEAEQWFGATVVREAGLSAWDATRSGPGSDDAAAIPSPRWTFGSAAPLRARASPAARAAAS